MVKISFVIILAQYICLGNLLSLRLHSVTIYNEHGCVFLFFCFQLGIQLGTQCMTSITPNLFPLN